MNDLDFMFKNKSYYLNALHQIRLKGLLLCLSLVPYNGLLAQTELHGLGTFTIGVTTPDSLNPNEFTEDDQSYVKGTIALPCTHIRSFTTPKVAMAGMPVLHLTLFFYDDKLFKLACDYSDELERTFVNQYGNGSARPLTRLSLCSKEKAEPLLIWGEIWQQSDIRAMVVRSKGSTVNCEQEEKVRLDISSRRLEALASDCELNKADQSSIEFTKILSQAQPQQSSGVPARIEKGRSKQ